MADLSPEAQAVFNATELDLQFAFDDGEYDYVNVRRFTAAATLRAASEGLSVRWAAAEIIAYLDQLADELEKYKP